MALSTRPMNRSSIDCHTCRRGRLKCDRTLPACQKCLGRATQCLGYGRLLRWNTGIASRGKMRGMTYAFSEDPRFPKLINDAHDYLSFRLGSVTAYSPPASLDPNPFLDDASKKYIHYFATDVCKDLVLHDTAESNQFRQLIPMALENPVLLQTIIAGSAMRMAHAFHRHSRRVTSSDLKPNYKKFYGDSLAAKQKAYELLRNAADPIHQTDSEIILAVIVLLIEAELIDVGRNNWKHHIQGATNVIEKLCGRDFSHVSTMSPLQKCLMSNCLIFEIIGSTTSGPLGRFSNQSTKGFLSLLQDAEGNHCSSFPTQLLRILQAGASLVPANSATTKPPPHCSQSARTEARTLFDAAHCFDPCAWAAALQARSPVADLEQRVHVASAHKAAVCIYIARLLLLLLGHSEELTVDMEILLSTGIGHLSQVGKKSPFFAATAWTSFVVGAEMIDSERRSWAVDRFNDLWEVEPWGSLREAITVLQLLWEEQDEMILSNGARRHDEAQVDFNWIRRLRDLNVHWLVI